MEMPLHISNWVDLLRSGKYEQTSGTLKRKTSTGGASYCCLGVYVEGVRNKHIKAVDISDKLDEGANLWYEICAGEIPAQCRLKGIEMNDRGKSFMEIADMIENYYTQLNS